MGRRQREWAVRARAQLVQDLGGVCVHCGDQSRLELDHKKGTEVVLRTLESSARVSMYRREAAQGKLQVLCRRCNKIKG